jgi:hypothetical protein
MQRAVHLRLRQVEVQASRLVPLWEYQSVLLLQLR